MPIGAAIGTQQTGIAQDVLATESGSGVPGSTFTARGAALQRQLASEGTEALAGLSLGARKQQEEMAAIRQEQQHGLMGLEGQLASARRGQVAGLKAQQSAGLSQMGSSLVGGAATGSSGALTSSMLS